MDYFKTITHTRQIQIFVLLSFVSLFLFGSFFADLRNIQISFLLRGSFGFSIKYFSGFLIGWGELCQFLLQFNRNIPVYSIILQATQIISLILLFVVLQENLKERVTIHPLFFVVFFLVVFAWDFFLFISFTRASILMVCSGFLYLIRNIIRGNVLLSFLSYFWIALGFMLDYSSYSLFMFFLFPVYLFTKRSLGGYLRTILLFMLPLFFIRFIPNFSGLDFYEFEDFDSALRITNDYLRTIDFTGENTFFLKKYTWLYSDPNFCSDLIDRTLSTYFTDVSQEIFTHKLKVGLLNFAKDSVLFLPLFIIITYHQRRAIVPTIFMILSLIIYIGFFKYDRNLILPIYLFLIVLYTGMIKRSFFNDKKISKVITILLFSISFFLHLVKVSDIHKEAIESEKYLEDLQEVCKHKKVITTDFPALRTNSWKWSTFRYSNIFSLDDWYIQLPQYQKYVYKIYGRNDLKHIVTHSKGSYFTFKNSESAQALSDFLKEIYHENVHFHVVDLPESHQLHGHLYSITY